VTIVLAYIQNLIYGQIPPLLSTHLVSCVARIYSGIDNEQSNLTKKVHIEFNQKVIKGRVLNQEIDFPSGTKCVKV
jgi:hypothetical protein